MTLQDEVLEVFRTNRERASGSITLRVGEVHRLIIISRREKAPKFLGLAFYTRPSTQKVHTAIHELKGGHPNLSRVKLAPATPVRLTLVHSR